jgi:hypothetical protein
MKKLDVFASPFLITIFLIRFFSDISKGELSNTVSVDRWRYRFFYLLIRKTFHFVIVYCCRCFVDVVHLAYRIQIPTGLL